MTVNAGFFGKIPARGDFVRAGLPPDFVAALDGWFQLVIPESREVLRDAWEAAWMEAPVWRFAFAAGVCGAGAACGLWLPSIDRAGRLFPLTIALAAPSWAALPASEGFLAAAEAAGMRALEQDTGPEALAAEIAAAAGLGGQALEAPKAGSSRWWTEGSPLVAASERQLAGLPGGAQFVAMLRD